METGCLAANNLPSAGAFFDAKIEELRRAAPSAALQMDLTGASVFVTGGAAGIGAGVAAALCTRHRCRLTLVDLDAEAGEATAAALRLGGGEAQFVRCDVIDAGALQSALDVHWQRYGSCDVAFLNAGIEERRSFLDTPSSQEWRRVLEIDTAAVVEGTRQLVRRWRDTQTRGTLLITSSAAGLYPVPGHEVYAAAKAAVVGLTRSLAPLDAREGIRVCALCPRFVDTAMVARMNTLSPGAVERESRGTRLLTLQEVVDAALLCLCDRSNAGKCLHVAPGVSEYWTFAGEEEIGRVRSTKVARVPPSASLLAWASAPLPATQLRVEVHALSSDFRAATRVAEAPMPRPRAGHVLLQRLWTGVNASDVNFSSGRYFGSRDAAQALLPFTAGFESVGVVAALGEGVKGWAIGDVAGSFSTGGFSQYAEEPAHTLLPGVPPSPEGVALLTSGLTASIALEQAARLRATDTVLVTAAAGGTGQFAVQLAARMGCRVVATCGGADKVQLLRRLGAHRVIDHTRESVRAVLKREFPKGIDVVYESVGGDMFHTALASLAPKGRLVVVGAMSRYATNWAADQDKAGPVLQDALLWKSASCCGFFLPLHAQHFRRHLARLAAMHAAGQLVVSLDQKSFVGLEAAADAVEHLQSGQSIGKVVLQVADPLPPGWEGAPRARL